MQPLKQPMSCWKADEESLADYNTVLNIRTACIAYLQASIEPNADVQAAVTDTLPRIVEEIERSPQHQLRLALETCDQYVQYVRSERARIQRLARSGSENAIYRSVARMERELERTWQPRMDEAFDTLRRQVAEPDSETYQQTMGRARLVREIDRRCQP